MRYRVAAIPDQHAPYTDLSAFNWVYSQIEEFKPDIIVNIGDGIEADAGSKFESDAEHDLFEEFRFLRDEILTPLSQLGASKLVYVCGNHEYNALENPGRIDRRLRRLIVQDFQEATEGWMVKPYAADNRGRYAIGQFIFRHGAKAGIRADHHETLNYGAEYCLHVMGHTHRPKPVTRIELPGAIPTHRYYANVGACVDWRKLAYARRCNVQSWGCGVFLGETDGSGEGLDRYAKKRWDAELRIRSLVCDG
jgi:predicted phosphodiesterase